MLLLGVVQAQAAGDELVSSFDLLETTVLTANAASVTFASLGTYAAEYQHLQIRAVARGARASTVDAVLLRLNGDTADNYNNHRLTGNGSSVASTSLSRPQIAQIPAASITSGAFGAFVVDILDPFETTKFTTSRSLSASTGFNTVGLHSTARRNTDAVTSLSIVGDNDDFVIGSRFSLYGIKAD